MLDWLIAWLIDWLIAWLLDWLIDWFVFYAVSAIFQPCNGLVYRKSNRRIYGEKKTQSVSHSVYFNEKITNKILNILNNNMQSVIQSLDSMCKTVIFFIN